MADLNSLEQKINILITDVAVVRNQLNTIGDKIKDNDDDIDKIDSRLTEVEMFKAKIVGIAFGVATLASVLFNIIVSLIGK